MLEKLISLLPALLIFLPFMDIALIRMIISSIQEGKPELGLFIIFYVQIVPQEILVRIFLRMLRNKTSRRWYYWASWVCRWALILMAVLSLAHVMQTGSVRTLLIPYLYKSGLWTDMALIPLGWISALCGLVLTLARKETRKKVLTVTAVGVPISLFIVGLFSADLEKSGALADCLFNLVLLWVPGMLAVVGALFDPLFGQKILEEEARKADEDAKAQQAASLAQEKAKKKKPDGRTAKPVDVEKMLTAEKADYERSLREREKRTRNVREEEPSEKMLKRMAEQLFSEGKAAASLGGQRQLLYWMTGAVPCLSELKQSRFWVRFYSPSLQDKPEAFLPVLEKLLLEAARRLEEGARETDTEYGAAPETLCAGWYALSCYAKVTRENTAFEQEAERLKDFLLSDRRCRAWLQKTDRAMKEGMERGSEDPDAVHSSNTDNQPEYVGVAPRTGGTQVHPGKTGNTAESP